MKEDLFNNDERLYLEMMQGNIERMSNNSASCKTWLITLVAGFMAISSSFDELHWWLLLALVPTAMFWYLDGLYLSLECQMRNRQRDLINKQSLKSIEYMKVLYNFQPLEMDKDDDEKGYVKTTGQWWTKSVLPFYLTIIIVIIVVTLVINWSLLPCAS